MSKNSIEFYYMPESPPCRLVEMVASLAGVTLNKHYINLFTKEQLGEDFLKLNPLHKVPFVVDGDLKINESRAISKYLIEKYIPGESALYPKDPVERARIDEVLFIDNGTLTTATYKLLAGKLHGPVAKLDEVAEKAYRDLLAYFENRLKSNGGKKFLLGDHLTLADISLATSFFFQDACSYDISEFKTLTNYLQSVKSAIPSFAEINDKPNENMRNYIKSKQEGK